jgi:hypothetical protein
MYGWKDVPRGLGAPGGTNLEEHSSRESGAKAYPHCLDRIHISANDMRRRFKAVWPDKIHQVHHRIFTSHTRDTKSDVLHYNAGGLMTNKVAVCESIFEHGNHGIAVVRRLGADVFEDEGEGLQTTGVTLSSAVR